MRAHNGFQGADPVQSVLELLGSDVILVPCRLRTKIPAMRWGEVALEKMSSPGYLAKLAKGNIGVVLGRRSGGLCTLDIDSDDNMSAFLDLNPDICQTLSTRGARGCNFWWRIAGPFPALTPLKVAGLPWGEWRADGAQTIISGVHPSGGRYTFLRRRKPLTVSFSDIRWPESMIPELSISQTMTVTESTQTPEPTQNAECTENPERTQFTEDTDDTDDNRCGKGSVLASPPTFTLEEALAAAKTLTPAANHERVFTLARGVRAVEICRGTSLSEAELRSVVKRWFVDSKPHLKKGVSFDEYFMEFMEGYQNVLHPLGAGILEGLWDKTATLPIPHAANQFEDLNIRRVVVLCRELWLHHKAQPFFISCRTLQRLLGHTEHVRAARWLRYLVRVKILAVVDAGSAETRRATRYQYLAKD